MEFKSTRLHLLMLALFLISLSIGVGTGAVIAYKNTQIISLEQEELVILLNDAEKKNFKPVYEKNFERDFNYTEKQYFKDVATIPDNLLEKLKNMPNNKGYIWRNIWCFGEKPVSHINEYTLYEKQNQKYLVHVYDLRTRTYSLYDKDNTGKQHLMNRKKF
jgi:chloramphenicol O-acetyltransferase